MRALVVFMPAGRHWLAPLLKRGFAHVGLILAVGDYWISIDPGLGTPEVAVPSGTTFDLAAHCRAKGWTVIETEARDIEAIGPFMLNNCVGLTKKFLGIRNPLILTPYQLWRHLTKGQP